MVPIWARPRSRRTRRQVGSPSASRSTRARTRPRSSAAAFSVKVTAQSLAGGSASPLLNFIRMHLRITDGRVLHGLDAGLMLESLKNLIGIHRFGNRHCDLLPFFQRQPLREAGVRRLYRRPEALFHAASV